MLNRRFLQSAAGVAALTAMGRRAYAFYQSGPTPKFTQPFRGVGPGGIPVALPDAAPAPVTGALHYSFNICQYQDTLHSTFGPTTLWGYSPAVALGEAAYPTRHLGGIIVAQKGVPIQLTFTNNLPANHILPVDVSNGPMAVGGFPHAAAKYGGSGHNAASVHLHGGFVPWISDGMPMAWFTPGGGYGGSIASNGTNHYRLLNPALQPGQAEYYYPNAQSARMMWYHDHAHEITRLNAYAGMASAYIIRDAFESNLRNAGLPDFVENGGRELPIVIQDKIFVGASLATVDPTWPAACPNTPGSLWYPHIYERNRWKASGGGNTVTAIPDPSCIPEMFGDTMLANGVVFPEAAIEARRYRLRILNACQARFLNLQLYVDDGSVDGITLNAALAPTNAKGPDLLVIGTEGGFLSKPVLVPSNIPFNPMTMKGSLVTGPAERWDVIVDFSGFAGKKVILYNDAPSPFPMGDPRNDYFPGAPKNPTVTTPGFGPNTRQILRFNVVPATGLPDPPLGITTATDLTSGIDPSLVGTWTTAPLPPPAGVPVRVLTLNEDFDAWGRLLQRLGSNVQPAKVNGNSFGRNYMDASTENPLAGSTEVWQIVNMTADVHPMHFHLVNVQVLQRQSFNSFGPANKPALPNYNAPAVGPDPLELGWKETVKMYPGTVTTIIMRFDLPPTPPGIASIPNSLNTSLGVAGKEYVWHCHILEHEEHDMMRPLVVV